MSVVDLQELEEVKGLLLKGQQVGVLSRDREGDPLVAEVALKSGASYFDLTEDVATSDKVSEIAKKAADEQIFMPQCGLAPGFMAR